MTFTEKLKRLGVCEEVIDYASRFSSLKKAWDACERGDWMLWLIGKKAGRPGSHKRPKLVLCTCEVARLVWKQMGPASKRAIQTAERRAKGDSTISIDDVRATAYATYAAYAATLEKAANIIRKYYPNPPKL